MYNLGGAFMYTSTILADRIKARAKEQHIQLKTIWKEIDITDNTLTNLRKGSMLGADTLALIADCLNCSVDYLLGRTDNPNISTKTYINGENGIQTVVGGAIENNTVTISATDEMTKEIGLLLSNLTYRQKTDLMKQIYDFVDDTKKKES